MATSVIEMLEDGNRLHRPMNSKRSPVFAPALRNRPKTKHEAAVAGFLPVADRSPAGSATTESLNSALRSLHEPEIIVAKRQAAQHLLQTIPEGGGRFELTEEDAHAWVAAVNDIRLALGTMLEVGPDGPQRLPAGHPMAGHFDVYQWLTVLQEYLVLGLMGKR